MSRPARVGHLQLQSLAASLSPRDIGILEKIGQLRFLQTSQIRRLCFHEHTSIESAERVCRRVLKRLHDAGLIRRLERRIGGLRSGSEGHIYVLSPLGHRLLGNPKRRRHYEPGLRHLRHSLAISELVTSLREASRTGTFDILQIQSEPDCWRRYSTGLATETLKPDLLVQVADLDYELSWFIEVDCGTESSITVLGKCQAYVDYQRSGQEQTETGVFPRVLWSAPDQRRADMIRTAIDAEQLPADLFAVTTHAEALAAVTDFSGP